MWQSEEQSAIRYGKGKTEVRDGVLQDIAKCLGA